jgi:hypothetical protein
MTVAARAVVTARSAGIGPGPSSSTVAAPRQPISLAAVAEQRPAARGGVCRRGSTGAAGGVAHVGDAEKRPLAPLAAARCPAGAVIVVLWVLGVILARTTTLRTTARSRTGTGTVRGSQPPGRLRWTCSPRRGTLLPSSRTSNSCSQSPTRPRVVLQSGCQRSGAQPRGRGRTRVVQGAGGRQHRLVRLRPFWIIAERANLQLWYIPAGLTVPSRSQVSGGASPAPHAGMTWP